MPLTVGKLRRVGCHVPSGQTVRGPAIPQRSRVAAKPVSAPTASGAGTTSGFEKSTQSHVVAAMPRLTFSESRRGRAFSSTRTAPASPDGTEPGVFATTTSSSTCRASTGTSVSSSRACPWDTTIAATLIARAPPGRP